MRNLKRALSLALASVMLLGMMVVGTSAASYPDVDSNDNVEAIEVLNAVEVMIGDRGNFRPDSPVNRHEMAAIMARLYLGKDAAENYVGSHPFTDVYPWADKYVAACYENGLINGTSKTTFSGNQPLTAIQAAAMMLRALGYEDLSKGAADWRTPVAAKANQIRLFKDVVSASNAQLTRNEVAQLALNTLKSTMVTTKKGTNIDLGEIGSITTDREYTPREVDVTRANDPAIAFDPGATVPGKYALQLGEDLYDGKLKLVAGNDDDFGRPGDSRWTYDGKEVYNVVKDATATFTAKTSAANVLKALKGYEYNGKKISVESDVKAAIADKTANGKLVEVFVSDNEIIKVVEVTYTVAKVTNVSTNKDGDVSYTLDNSGGTGRDYADPDKDDTIVIDGSVAKDDIVTYAKAGNVLYVYPTTNFVGAQSSFKTSTRAGTIVVNGTTYDVGTGLTNVAQDGTDGKFPNSDDDATFYVDQFGYVVKSDAVETNTEYAVIDAIIYKAADGLDGKPYAQANLILADGTKVGNAKVVKINGLDLTKDVAYTTAAHNGSDEGDAVLISTHASDKVNGEPKVTALALCPTVNDNSGFKGMIVAYSEDKGDYTLTIKNLAANLSTVRVNTATSDPKTNTAVIAATAKTTLDSGAVITTKDVPSVLLSAGVTTDGKTVYVVKTGSDKWSTYTGFRNVPTIKTGASTAAADKVTVSVVVKDGKAEFVYIDASATNAVNGEDSGDIMYLVSKTPTTSGKDKDLIYEAIVNGEKTTVKVKNGTSAVNSAFASGENKLFTLTYDADGYVSAVTAITTSGAWHAGATLTDDVSSDDGTIGGYTYDSSAKVIAIEDGEIIDGATVETAVKGDTIWVKTKGTTGADQYKIDTIYIVKDGDKAIVGTTPDAALIEAALAGDGSATLANGVNIPDGVSIPNGSKLTLSGTATIATGKTLTVEEGGTLVITGAVTCSGTGKIELNGGTIEIDSVDVELPVIKGDGVISVDSGKAAGKDDGTSPDRLTDLKNKIGVGTPTASKDLTTKTATFSIDSSNTVGVMGEGKVQSWSVALTIDEMAARTGGNKDSKVIFVELNLSGAGFSAGAATVKYTNTSGTTDSYDTGSWTLTSNMCSGTDTVVIPVTADVVSITVSQ